MKRLITLLAVLAAAACAHAEQAPGTAVTHATTAVSTEVVEVSGDAIVTLAPDRVVFNVGVETFASNVTDAVRENNQRVEKVIAALKSAGAKADEIQTSNYSIYPRQEYRENQQPRIVGYQVNNSITVRKQDPTAASRLLEAAINAGANSSSGLSLVISDPAAGQKEGLEKAYQSACRKAEILAAAAGRKLGRALSIAEGAGPAQPSPTRMYAAARLESAEASVGNVPISPGTQEKRFTVTVVFELE